LSIDLTWTYLHPTFWTASPANGNAHPKFELHPAVGAAIVKSGHWHFWVNRAARIGSQCVEIDNELFCLLSDHVSHIQIHRCRVFRWEAEMTALHRVFACASLLAFLGAGCDIGSSKGTGASGGSATTPAAKKTYTREQFKNLIIGKNQEGVIAAVGKPDTTQEFGGEPTWYYNGIATDPVTGKVGDAQLIFKDGVVIRVNY
jgi:hypothetical protein